MELTHIATLIPVFSGDEKRTKELVLVFGSKQKG